MKETIFEQVASAAAVLKLDLSAEEFALFAEDREFSEARMEAVQMLLGLSQRKETADHHSDLIEDESSSNKHPKTFENFDFSLLKEKDVERLKVLSSLNAIYSHRNLAPLLARQAQAKHIWPLGWLSQSSGKPEWWRITHHAFISQKHSCREIYSAAGGSTCDLPVGKLMRLVICS